MSDPRPDTPSGEGPGTPSTALPEEISGRAVDQPAWLKRSATAAFFAVALLFVT